MPANHACDTQVVPFTAQKQNAVITGVANALGDGVLASDIALAVLQDDSHVRRLPVMCGWKKRRGQILQGCITTRPVDINMPGMPAQLSPPSLCSTLWEMSVHVC